MAEKLDPQLVVTFEGLLTNEEVLEEIKAVRREMGGETGAVIRTTREKGGIKVEVIRDDTNQVIWRKFVPWSRIDRLPEVFA
ncbi:MAG: hypothetical protein O6837_11780, partial [Deltaproteobacteria bacterium]|nr:hypothetical protein [Deltaproteobacteria bacterium]